jgi:hypothetical protein
VIAADTSTWVAFLEGIRGEDTDWLDRALADSQLIMVLAELLSDPKLSSDVTERISEVPLIESAPGFITARND